MASNFWLRKYEHIRNNSYTCKIINNTKFSNLYLMHMWFDCCSISAVRWNIYKVVLKGIIFLMTRVMVVMKADVSGKLTRPCDKSTGQGKSSTLILWKEYYFLQMCRSSSYIVKTKLRIERKSFEHYAAQQMLFIVHQFLSCLLLIIDFQ